jgi:hypothetical protein
MEQPDAKKNLLERMRDIQKQLKDLREHFPLDTLPPEEQAEAQDIERAVELGLAYAKEYTGTVFDRDEDADLPVLEAEDDEAWILPMEKPPKPAGKVQKLFENSYNQNMLRTLSLAVLKIIKPAEAVLLDQLIDPLIRMVSEGVYGSYHTVDAPTGFSSGNLDAKVIISIVSQLLTQRMEQVGAESPEDFCSKIKQDRQWKKQMEVRTVDVDEAGLVFGYQFTRKDSAQLAEASTNALIDYVNKQW